MKLTKGNYFIIRLYLSSGSDGSACNVIISKDFLTTTVADLTATILKSYLFNSA